MVLKCFVCWCTSVELCISGVLDGLPDLERVSTYLLAKAKAELQFSTIGPVNPRTITQLLLLRLSLEKLFEVMQLLEDHGSSALLESIVSSLRSPAVGAPSSEGTSTAVQSAASSLSSFPTGGDCQPSPSSWSDSAWGSSSSSSSSSSSVNGLSPSSVAGPGSASSSLSLYTPAGDTSTQSGASDTDATPGSGAVSETALERIQRALSTKLRNSDGSQPKGPEALRSQQTQLARFVIFQLTDNINVLEQ